MQVNTVKNQVSTISDIPIICPNRRIHMYIARNIYLKNVK